MIWLQTDKLEFVQVSAESPHGFLTKNGISDTAMVRLCLHLANWNISIYTKTETYGFDSPNGKNPVQNKLSLK